MNPEEHNILVCMSDEWLDILHLVGTLAALTGIEPAATFGVATYLRVWSMEISGLVETRRVGDPKILPEFRLTPRGLLERANLVSKNPSIESSVLSAYARVEDMIINSAPSG